MKDVDFNQAGKKGRGIFSQGSQRVQRQSQQERTWHILIQESLVLCDWAYGTLHGGGAGIDTQKVCWGQMWKILLD